MENHSAIANQLEQLGAVRTILQSQLDGRPIDWEVSDSTIHPSDFVIQSPHTDPFDFLVPRGRYCIRIKANRWTLGRSVNGFTLGEGQEWHRQDFTEEMLPDGWRPHIMSEKDEAGDQWLSKTGWKDVSWYNNVGSWEHCEHYRTRRPLPPSKSEPETFESHGKMWFRHTPGDPMPCDKSAVVTVLYETDEPYEGTRCPAHCFNWRNTSGYTPIVGWRYADETPAQVEQAPSPQGGKWMGHPKGNDSAPTDNDAWESLLHTNATLGREVSRLRTEVEVLKAQLNQIREVLE